ncbi:hypothetical protein NOS3756_07130 [Nostoc sp. NIES-3756]|uniref:PEP-CTERM exosortase interaction domain-containing protein n=1 Tax=Nostoc sp. NIES-3756 TaxID=1751286 RepID=UPI00072126C6|nr:PEP-CTERM exosortase interaction domain-containing protein [Nostoc sp. NIES-3756]BAT51784.1 hypothetical protein NOS3756_07130 [Nostoc sp. NIES-3756]
MKLVPQVMLVAASLSLGFATVDVKSASAAIINYAFTVESPTAKGKGFFSFDNSTLNNQDNPTAIVKLLSFQFDGDSNVYTEKNDVNYPDFPIVYSTIFSSGKSSLALSYLFDDQANPANSIRYEIAGEDFTIFSTTSSGEEIVSGTVTYSQVPEPTNLVGAGIALGISLMFSKKPSSIKKLKV